MNPSRRSLLAGAALVGSAGLATTAHMARAADRKVLRLHYRTIEVDGKPARRYRVSQPSGEWGLTLGQGDMFDVRLENNLDVLSGLHWHGLNPPWRQDGVPYLTGPPIAPGKFADYTFPARPFGTRWMHSHFGLQEQNLAAAPLIIREAEAIQSGIQEVVVMFEDFSWRKPEAILADLRKPKPAMAMGNMQMTGGTTSMARGGTSMASGGDAKPDLNDVTYDAYLANDRTFADPEIFNVEPGANVRLRLLNGSASSNFMVEFGGIEVTLLTVDGNPVAPLKLTALPLAIAQRADVLLRMPNDKRAVPIVARGEGRMLQTGVILRPGGAAVTKVPTNGAMAAPALGLGLEKSLRAREPLASRPVDRRVPIELTGNMAAYVWGIGVHGMEALPVTVEKGERVELVMRNTTMMSHPMHLHGHSYQVVEIDGQRLAGAVRDTVLVPPGTTITVAFDADNPGMWAYHCHNLYHMAAGMFATVVYRGFS
ncbi:MAG: multicopper oxidase family protein [Reyranella sp.]|uniref:multicopper oxidase family protein n=1 Tax=Reyranella sp. TaxID=1929291 RepID=UPI003D096CFE